MVGAFAGLSPVLQAFLATMFTWGMTAAGAALVFGTKNVPRKLLDSMLGFAAGVMIAASFWSLLAPAIELSEAGSLPVWVPPVIGFLAGGLFLRGLDGVLPHLHPGMKVSEAEGLHTTWRRSVLLVSAITLHNIPEGLAIGVAFGAVGLGITEGVPGASLGAAVALAIGIGLQNFPEGTAVSMPLRREGISRGSRSGGSTLRQAHPALRPGICGRGDDLRGRRGTHSRGQAGQPGHSRPLSHGRFLGHDEPGCRALLSSLS